MLQARIFAYSDAAHYRLGVNLELLQCCNKAKSPVYSPFQRDGFIWKQLRRRSGLPMAVTKNRRASCAGLRRRSDDDFVQAFLLRLSKFCGSRADQRHVRKECSAEEIRSLARRSSLPLRGHLEGVPGFGRETRGSAFVGGVPPLAMGCRWIDRDNYRIAMRRVS